MERQDPITLNRPREYRDQAAIARELAEQATNLQHREAYLKLAQEWEKLADEIETGTFAAFPLR